MRAQEIVNSRKETICADDLQAMSSLVTFLRLAKRDAENVKKRMVN